MELVLIAGPPAAGKTTVARRVARRHGFRLYSADTRTWRHRDRALAGGSAAAWRWEARSPAERWHQPVEELVATSLHRERGAMVLDDLRALPERPLTIAEGSVIPADAVAAGVVWLLPTPEFQEEQLAARATAPGPAALYRRLRELAERDARTHGLSVLPVDGSIGVDELVRRVERLLESPLALAPRAESPSERRALLREVNEALVEQLRDFYARPWANGVADEVRRLFVCECGDPGCEQEVETTVGRAADGPVLAGDCDPGRA